MDNILLQNILKCLEVHEWPYEKKRLGKNNDGGYVICDVLEINYDVLISGGISNDISFEEDFLNYCDVPAYAFDHTIDNLPVRIGEKLSLHSEKINFVKKQIGILSNDHQTNLVDLVQNYKNVFMKMDIEGYEFLLFKALDRANMIENIAQLVIEIHPTNLTVLHEFLVSIYKTHVLFHAHANNAIDHRYNIKDILIPGLLELTFINKNKINWELQKNKTLLPMILDQPNISKKEEISLTYYPFVV